MAGASHTADVKVRSELLSKANNGLRRAAKAAARVARRVADLIPLTPLGLVVLACGGFTWAWMGAGRHDHVLGIAALVALALVAVSVVAVTAGTVVLALLARRARTTSPIIADAEQRTVTSFAGLPFRLVPFLRVSWGWQEPRGVRASAVPRGSRLCEEIVAGRRGVHASVNRRFVVEDALGLSALAFRVTEPVKVELRPALGRMRRAPVVSTLAGGDDLPHPWGSVEGDRLELRRWSHADPARLIVWKIFGRTRKLVVRQPERAIARAHTVAAYLVVAPEDEAAAAAARLAVETGALGQKWVLGADGIGRDARDADGALELIAASGCVGQSLASAVGLKSFVERNESQGPVRCLVFAPAALGPWLDRVAGLAARRRGLVDVVLAGDDIGAERRRSAWFRLFLAGTERPTVSSRDVEGIAGRLARAGAHVAIIDRRSGRVQAPAHLWRGALVA